MFSLLLRGKVTEDNVAKASEAEMHTRSCSNKRNEHEDV